MISSRSDTTRGMARESFFVYVLVRLRRRTKTWPFPEPHRRRRLSTVYFLLSTSAEFSSFGVLPCMTFCPENRSLSPCNVPQMILSRPDTPRCAKQAERVFCLCFRAHQNAHENRGLFQSCAGGASSQNKEEFRKISSLLLCDLCDLCDSVVKSLLSFIFRGTALCIAPTLPAATRHRQNSYFRANLRHPTHNVYHGSNA